jgi:50S ribosomal subunit-associated GTPase HflX
MADNLIRCFLLAHQGPHDQEEDIAEHLKELGELARSSGMEPIGRKLLKRPAIESRT